MFWEILSESSFFLTKFTLFKNIKQLPIKIPLLYRLVLRITCIRHEVTMKENLMTKFLQMVFDYTIYKFYLSFIKIVLMYMYFILMISMIKIFN